MGYPWNKRKVFELKEEHFKLLGNAYFQWNNCEYGAPEIDPKRPFGNSGRHTILLEMAKLLNLETFKDMNCEDNITKEQAKYLEKIWHETPTALRIIHRHRTFTPGTYEATGYNMTGNQFRVVRKVRMMDNVDNLWERIVWILEQYGDEPHEIEAVWISQGWDENYNERPSKKLDKSEWYHFFVDQPDGSGYGGTKCTAFHLYSKSAILFMGCYDGSEWVESIPKNPDEPREVEHVGGG